MILVANVKMLIRVLVGCGVGRVLVGSPIGETKTSWGPKNGVGTRLDAVGEMAVTGAAGQTAGRMGLV